MSIAAARRLGIAEDRWVFLHGHADLHEPPLLRRPDLSPAAAPRPGQRGRPRDGRAVDVGHGDHRPVQLFPDPGLQHRRRIRLRHRTTRAGMTLSGGLPFFGGAGNNYSMHAVIETLDRARSAPGTFGFVGANGGTLTKYSVGVYSTTPAPWRADRSGRCKPSWTRGPPSPSPGTRRVRRRSRPTPFGIPATASAAASSSAASTPTAGASSPPSRPAPTICSTCSASANRSTPRSTCAHCRKETGSRPRRRSWTQLTPGSRSPVSATTTSMCWCVAIGHLLEVTINRPNALNAHPPAGKRGAGRGVRRLLRRPGLVGRDPGRRGRSGVLRRQRPRLVRQWQARHCAAQRIRLGSPTAATSPSR